MYLNSRGNTFSYRIYTLFFVIQNAWDKIDSAA